MPSKPDPRRQGLSKGEAVPSSGRRNSTAIREERNENRAREESRHVRRTPRYDALEQEKGQESSSDDLEVTNPHDERRRNKSREFASGRGDDDDEDRQSRTRHTKQEPVSSKGYSRPLGEPSHFDLESGDVTKSGRHTREFPPISNPSGTPRRHAKEDSGYGSSLLAQSPVSSPPGPTRRPIGEALKQTVSAQDSTQSCLSHVSQLFAQIKITEFAECKTFIENRPGVLKEDATQFLREAALAHYRSETQYARACVHRGLLIRKCARMDRDECVRFLHNLATGRKSTVSDFLDDLDDSVEAMKSRADKLAAPEAPSLPLVAPSGYDRHAPHAPQMSVMTMQPSSYPRGPTDTLGPLPSFQGLQIGQTPAYKFPPKSFTAPTRDERFGDLPAARTSHQGRANRGSRDSIQSEIEIRGTEGEAETLDPRYRRQRDPGSFFVVGKVFAVLWHENMGRSTGQPKPGSDVKFISTIKTDKSTVGLYGERIFSHIRRMVVVRRRYGYCWCVSINTYGKKGVSGKNRADDEDRSHTIVYDSTKQPQSVPGEKKSVKEPIAIIMTPPETLHATSRLNYAKVQTVEHNVKVLDVGMVHPNSMAFFEAHWENEISKK